MAADPEKYLCDAVAAADRIARFTAGKSRDGYLADDLLRSAVERQFEIIGEALAAFRRASPERAGAIPELAWIVSFRNVLAHEYGDVDDGLVWDAVESKLPNLRATLARLLGEAKG